MQLADWMKSKGLVDEAMAELVRSGGAECSRSTITRLRRGDVWLSRELALKIKEVTGGEVTADDFADLRVTE